MAAAEASGSEAKHQLLALIETLFDTRWDRVLAGVVYALATTWFWWNIGAEFLRPDGDFAAPFDGLHSALTALALPEPDWTVATGQWFSGRGAVFGVVIAIAAASCATVFAKTGASGPEVCTVILTLLSAEVIGSRGPAVAVGATYALAGFAAVLAIWQARPGAGRDGWKFDGWNIGRRLVQALLPFLTAIFFPFAVLAYLVTCYTTEERPPVVATGAMPLP